MRRGLLNRNNLLGANRFPFPPKITRKTNIIRANVKMGGIWITRRRCLWTRSQRYLLQTAVMLYMLSGNVSSNGITSTVTITPNVTKPYEWVTLRCQFNLNAEETTLLYWGDKNGDTLYIHEKDKPVRKGPKYSNGEIQNIQTNSGDHSLELYVDGCNKSPYKCDIWRDTDEKIKQASLEIKNIQTPTFFMDDVKTTAVNIEANTTYKFKCECNNATEKHNLTMEIEGMSSQSAPDPVDSTYKTGNCLYSSKVEKEFDLTTADEFSVKCVARYDKGDVKVSTVMTPSPCSPNPCLNAGKCLTVANSFLCECPKNYSGSLCESFNMASSTMMNLEPWIIIVIAVVAGLIVIAIVTIVAVCAVKKKKGWCMAEPAKQGNGTYPTNSDFQYSQDGTGSPVNERQTDLEQGYDDGYDYVEAPENDKDTNEIIKSKPLDVVIPPQRPEKPISL